MSWVISEVYVWLTEPIRRLIIKVNSFKHQPWKYSFYRYMFPNAGFCFNIVFSSQREWLLMSLLLWTELMTFRITTYMEVILQGRPNLINMRSIKNDKRNAFSSFEEETRLNGCWESFSVWGSPGKIILSGQKSLCYARIDCL